MKRYIDQYGFLLESWPNYGIGDALWRTGIQNIISKKVTTDASYFNGMAFRHPTIYGFWDYPDNGCTRDQVTMDFCSRIINKAPLPKLRWRFSDKSFWYHLSGIDFRMWVRAIRKNKKGILFITLWRVLLPILFKWNDFCWRYGHQTKIPMDFNPPPGSGKKTNIYWRIRYPFYAFHLLSWQVYVLPDSRAKRKLNGWCVRWLKNTPTRFHPLLFKLHDDAMLASKLFNAGYAKPRTDYPPQRRLDRLPPGVELSPYDGPYQIDVDILKAM